MGFGIPTPNDYDEIVGIVDVDVDGDGVGDTSLWEPEYSLRVAEGATYTYIGEANPGSSEGALVWRIKRMTNADTTIVWAEGTSDFDKIWNNHLSYSYI